MPRTPRRQADSAPDVEAASTARVATPTEWNIQSRNVVTRDIRTVLDGQASRSYWLYDNDRSQCGLRTGSGNSAHISVIQRQDLRAHRRAGDLGVNGARSSTTISATCGPTAVSSSAEVTKNLVATARGMTSAVLYKVAGSGREPLDGIAGAIRDGDRCVTFRPDRAGRAEPVTSRHPGAYPWRIRQGRARRSRRCCAAGPSQLRVVWRGGSGRDPEVPCGWVGSAEGAESAAGPPRGWWTRSGTAGHPLGFSYVRQREWAVAGFRAGGGHRAGRAQVALADSATRCDRDGALCGVHDGVLHLAAAHRPPPTAHCAPCPGQSQTRIIRGGGGCRSGRRRHQGWSVNPARSGPSVPQARLAIAVIPPGPLSWCVTTVPSRSASVLRLESVDRIG